MRVVRCVDPGGETPDWKGEIGFVPTVVEQANIPAENAVALVIGPPIMIKFTLPVLAKMGLADRDIYTSLENRMKCGVGKCGRCNAARSTSARKARSSRSSSSSRCRWTTDGGRRTVIVATGFRPFAIARTT